MKLLKTKLTAVAVMLVLGSHASASNKLGAYVSGGIGFSSVIGSDYSIKLKISGQSVLSKNDDTVTSRMAFSGHVAAGYNFSNLFNIPVRVELEGDFRSSVDPTKLEDKQSKSNDESLSITSNTLFLNTYYDYSISDKLSLFATFGLGTAFNNAKLKMLNQDISDSTNTNFAYTIGAGMSQKINDNLSATVKIRYVNAGKFKSSVTNKEVNIEGRTLPIDSEISGKISRIDAQVGLTYSF